MKRAGRWHSVGRPIVYLAEHPALALLETLVHLEVDTIDDLPDTYTLLKVEIVDPPNLMVAKDGLKDKSASRKIGDDWLKGEGSLILQVPSVLVPESANFLFNPSHADAGKAQIVRNYDWPFDTRFVKNI